MRWSDPAVLLAVLAAAFGASLALTMCARRYALRRGLMDQPGKRRSHAQSTPRGGGIGIAIIGLLGLVGLGAWIEPAWHLLGAGLALVFLVGWIDDHRSLSPWLRLLVHTAAGGCVAGAVLMQGGGSAVAVAGFLVVPVLVNVWNFMDGINGIATTQAALCAFGFAMLLQGPVQAFAVAVLGALLGFLPLNFPSARVFLGDVGSGATGYLIAVLMLLGLDAVSSSHWPVLLLPPAAFLIDSGLTLLMRIARREAWWRPHVQHMYQRLSRRIGHAAVTLAYAGWTGMTVGVMLGLQRTGPQTASAVTVAVLIVAMLTWCLMYRHFARTEGFGA